jgi:hypothetical protein
MTTDMQPLLISLYLPFGANLSGLLFPDLAAHGQSLCPATIAAIKMLFELNKFVPESWPILVKT